jgi:hypothetical protein
VQDIAPDKRPKRIHVTGSPRSGTTLLLALLLSCFDIDGGVPQERRLKRTPPSNCRIVCTKFPNETDFAARMLHLDPDLHVIFMLRDPRDVIASRSHLRPSVYLTNLRIWRENLEQARPYFGHRRFHVVYYRDLTENPDLIQRRIAREIPFLRPRRRFSKYTDHAREEGGNWLKSMHMRGGPIARDRGENWRRHLGRVKGQLIIHGDVSDALIEFGFEPNKSWLFALDSVMPDFKSSAADERTGLGKRITRLWRNSTGSIAYLSRRYLGIELTNPGKTAAQEADNSASSQESSSLAA